MHFKTLFISTGLLLLAGCATSPIEKNLDAKLTNEAPVENRAALQSEAKDLIANAPGLSDTQREQLTTLRQNTRTKIDGLTEESLKLRGLLVQDLFSTKYNQTEVDSIKERLKTTEDKRLSALFEAVENANRILGREAEAHREIGEDFVHNFSSHKM